jgi:uncharacterized membrane protein
MSLSEALRLVAQTIATLVEGVGIAIVAVAVVLASVRYLAGLAAQRRALPSDAVRLGLGRSLALALEFLLGADILRTAVEPSWDEIGRLAAIAAIRTALNFFLQREIARDAATTGGVVLADGNRPSDLGGVAEGGPAVAAQPSVPVVRGNRSHGHGLPA